MDKEKFLSKITPKDYHNELETILEDKDFSEDVKNLLLSCVYKIEAGYDDYKTVKQVVISKKEYLEEILKIIKEKCNLIQIKKDSISNNIKTKYEVDRLEGKITLWHPNEKNVLYAIYELDDNQIYVDEKYSLIRTSLCELLNKGENMNRLEVLRDFNGWNWNTDSDELQNITINLVYQNLISLLGISFMEQWIHTENMKDYLELAKQRIIEQFGEKLEKEIFSLISKLALCTCIQTNKKEQEHLQDEKKYLEIEFEKLSNKKELLEEISNNKKQALKKIKDIDTILNDKDLLEKEYIKRNEKLPEYHKIFSLSHLIEILNRERKKLMQKIEEENKMLEPSYYVEIKTKLEEKLELLSNLSLEKKELEKKIISYSINLQKAVMNCFKIRIDKIEQLEKNKKREEIIKEIYRFRYYCYLYLGKNKNIGMINELNKYRLEVEKKLMQKAEELKCIIKIAKEEKNINIFDVLFFTRIINLENIVIELQQKEQLELLIYETDVFEKKIKVELALEDLNIKLGKKVKLLG